ncbi:hypothetical protein [Alienimonas chondri]|uniref:Uncharacterized protein n=1 Tax=Alienimonas chondri TaxID=2681879 RepID=A0ABX1VE41_9PLAN|nr:hypothetical protein [Alienimonas chondri]NNJ25686.1 hypothetical protein [Alienimonas chondri]
MFRLSAVVPLLCVSLATFGLIGCGAPEPDNSRWEKAQAEV